MLRFAWLVAVMVVVGTSVRGQGTDEVKRLKEQIELLETKLKLSEREKEDLKKEVQELRAKGAGDKKPDAKSALSDRLSTGTALKGDWRFVNKNVSGSATLTITERKGDTVKAVYSVPGAKPGDAGNDQEMTGTISGNSISLKSISAPKPFTLKGELKDEYLNLTFDGPAGKASMKLK